MKQKILFILHYPPPVHGAAMVGQYIRNSKIVNEAIKSQYLNLSTSRTVSEIGKSSSKKWWRYLSLLLKTVSKIISFRPNCVYLTITAKGSGFYKDALVVIVAKALGAKMLYHFHNKGVSAKQEQWLDDFLYKIVFKDAEVILLSEHLYSDVGKYVPESRIQICPNGIPEIANEQKHNEHYESNKPTHILFLSNLIESKGIFVLLKACEILKEKGVFFQCNYVGGEGDITQVELQQTIEKSGLSKHVNYLGKKYGTDKIEVFKQTDIFAFPTFYSNECFPLVILESMQFGLPVVSTFEGGIPDLIVDGKTGFLVKQNDVNALADRLETLICNPDLRREIGANGREKYEQEFTLQSFERRFVSILKS